MATLSPPGRCVGILLAAASIHAPVASAAAPAAEKPGATVAFVNAYFAKTWKANGIEPAPPCDDYTFLRRVSLDLAGRVPKSAEIVAFLADPPESRRTLLVDRLLNSEDYAVNMADWWTVVLLERGAKDQETRALKMWLSDQFARNRPWSELVKDLLAAGGESKQNGAVAFTVAHLGQKLPKKDWASQGQFDAVPLTWKAIRTTLGIDLRCCRCHDHPFTPELKQATFWEINAFFRQVGLENDKLVDDPELQKVAGKLEFEKRNGKRVAFGPRFLDGKAPAAADERPRRQILAASVIDHPQFARALANRMWAHCFGRGLNERAAADDFGEHNPLLHPELLDRLAADVRADGHDLKKLLRWICTSDAYQLDSAANATNDKVDAIPLFSRMPRRPLSPEQLVASLLVLANGDGRLPKEAKQTMLEAWHKSAGKIDVEPLCDNSCNSIDRPREPVLTTLMAALNNPDVSAPLFDPDRGPIAMVNKGDRPAAAVSRDLYLAVLCRFPTEKEIAKVQREVEAVRAKDARADLTSLWQDLVWALVNSAEFAIQH